MMVFFSKWAISALKWLCMSVLGLKQHSWLIFFFSFFFWGGGGIVTYETSLKQTKFNLN